MGCAGPAGGRLSWARAATGEQVLVIHGLWLPGAPPSGSPSGPRTARCRPRHRRRPAGASGTTAPVRRRPRHARRRARGRRRARRPGPRCSACPPGPARRWIPGTRPRRRRRPGPRGGHPRRVAGPRPGVRAGCRAARCCVTLTRWPPVGADPAPPRPVGRLRARPGRPGPGPARRRRGTPDPPARRPPTPASAAEAAGGRGGPVPPPPGRWRPLLTGTDAAWARALALALPPAPVPPPGRTSGRPAAGPVPAGTRPRRTLLAVLVADALDTLTDAAVRAALTTDRVGPGRTPERGGAGLAGGADGGGARVHRRPGRLDALRAELDAWQRDAAGGAVRASFRLVEPPADEVTDPVLVPTDPADDVVRLGRAGRRRGLAGPVRAAGRRRAEPGRRRRRRSGGPAASCRRWPATSTPRRRPSWPSWARPAGSTPSWTARCAPPARSAWRSTPTGRTASSATARADAGHAPASASSCPAGGRRPSARLGAAADRHAPRPQPGHGRRQCQRGRARRHRRLPLRPGPRRRGADRGRAGRRWPS